MAGSAIYVRRTNKSFGELGDSTFTSSQGEINLPAVGSSDIRPCYVCIWHANDARTTSTDGLSFWTTDFATQDTDWKVAWSAGANLVLEPGAVYYKVGPADAAEHAVGWRLDGTGMEGGHFGALLFSEVRQDTAQTIVGDAQGQHSTSPPHSYTVAPASSDSIWVTHGLNAYDNQDLPDFIPDTDMTELWDTRIILNAGSDGIGLQTSMSWGNRDTDWTTLKQDFSSSVVEISRTAVFQIYHTGIIPQGTAGLLQFTGTSWRTAYRDKEVAGTLTLSGAFAQLYRIQPLLVEGTLVLYGVGSRITAIIAAVVRMVLSPIATIKTVLSPIAFIRTILNPKADDVELK